MTKATLLVRTLTHLCCVPGAGVELLYEKGRHYCPKYEVHFYLTTAVDDRLLGDIPEVIAGFIRQSRLLDKLTSGNNPHFTFWCLLAMAAVAWEFFSELGVIGMMGAVLFWLSLLILWFNISAFGRLKQTLEDTSYVTVMHLPVTSFMGT